MSDMPSLQQELKRRLWAKSEPFKPLLTHLIETGSVAQVLLEEGAFVTSGRQLSAWLGISSHQMVDLVGYLASLHDIGKIHPAFMGSSPESKIWLTDNHLSCSALPFRHEKYGAKCAARIWRVKKRFSSKMCILFSAILRLHHQGKTARGWECDNPTIWHDEQDDTENSLFELFSPPPLSQISHTDAACMLLSAVVIVSDWIASGDIFSGTGLEQTPQAIRKNAIEITRRFLESNEMTWKAAPCITNFTQLWPWIPPKDMRPLQHVVEDIFRDPAEMPLCVLLEAPMGEGKTEAALYVAFCLAQRWHKQGFYMGLPTAATSNQMYSRVNRMLESHDFGSARLLHAAAWMIDEHTHTAYSGDSAESAPLWTTPSRRAFLAGSAVGTVDQVMMSVLKVRYGSLRLLGLDQKVLIIDEIHAYDAYMSEILERLLSWCREMNTPAVLLSATLPSAKKNEYARIYDSAAGVSLPPAYPAVTLFYQDRPVRAVPVAGSHQQLSIQLAYSPFLGNAEATAELAAKRFEVCNSCMCVLLNTVGEAQKVYRILRRKGLAPLLFHARFSARRRSEIEQEALELFGPKKTERIPHILVSTQVTEQSLDLDFDEMITALCPIDLLLQRAGRVWRHDDTERPEHCRPRMHVLLPAQKGNYGVTGRVYANALLERTEQQLSGRTEMRLPDDIQPMVEAVYDDKNLPRDLLEKWYEHLFEEDVHKNAADGCLLPPPSEDSFCFAASEDLFMSDSDVDELPAATRLGERSVRIAMMPAGLFDSAAGISPSSAVAKEVLLRSFSVPARMLGRSLHDSGENGLVYVEGRGLLQGIWLIKASNEQCMLNNGDEWIMDRDLGFIIKKGGEA